MLNWRRVAGRLRTVIGSLNLSLTAPLGWILSLQLAVLLVRNWYVIELYLVSLCYLDYALSSVKGSLSYACVRSLDTLFSWELTPLKITRDVVNRMTRKIQISRTFQGLKGKISYAIVWQTPLNDWQSRQHKGATKRSIAQRIRTDLERSVGATIVIQTVGVQQPWWTSYFCTREWGSKTKWNDKIVSSTPNGRFGQPFLAILEVCSYVSWTLTSPIIAICRMIWHFWGITFQLFELLCLAKDHWRGFSTRNAHMVHFVN